MKTAALLCACVLLLAGVAHTADHTHVVTQAYREILLRDPDPGGLAHFNAQLSAGMTEAALRETLMRSAEYAQRFPGPVPTPMPTPPPPPGVTRAAFYYPWFPATWTVNGSHVFYRPTLGYYSSDSTLVANTHIQALDYAKVNVAIASWWGQGQQSEQTRIPLLLDRTRETGSPLKWALYYEKEGFSDPAVADVVADLAYLARYASRPEYARRGGRPVLFVYNADDASCAVVDKWRAATAGQWYLALKVFPGAESCASQPDLWHEYAPSRSSVIVGQSYSVSPGFWRADEPSARLPRDLVAWGAAVRAMVASGKPWQLVATFNEFGEGSAVESTVEWGNAYLDVLRNDGNLLPTADGLRVQGNRFATAAGPIHLQGHIVCCDAEGTPEDEALVRGWPWVDTATLDLMAAHKLNYAHIRLGPFSHSEPNAVQGYRTVSHNADGGVFDLLQWDDATWARLRTLLAHAQTRGIYVELDLIDVWGLDHEVTPWSRHRNITGFDGGGMAVTQGHPHAIHEAWIRKAVLETAEFPNVLYSDGNESWKTSGTAWSEGVIAIAKDELARMGVSRPVGSNNEDVPSNADYLTFHQKTAAGARSVPVMVNEYQTLPVETVLAEAARARDIGTSFHYWAGGHNAADRLRTFAGLQRIIEGGEPPPVADSCPTLARWGSSLHVYHLGGTLLEIPRPVQQGAVKHYGTLRASASLVIDSTPRFGEDGRGFPCNEEKGFDACGGRNCEDPRGPEWALVEAPGGVSHRVGGNPFQYQVGPLAPGPYRLRVCPRPDVRDALGKPVTPSDAPCTETTWTVQ